MAVISRAFLEIGANTEGLQKGLDQAVKIAQENGAKLSAAGRSMVTNFENALNPTKQLAVQIEALQKAGKSAGDIQAVLGDKIKYATEQTLKHGQAVDPVIIAHNKVIGSTNQWKLSIDNVGKGLMDFAQNPIGAAQRGITSFLSTLGPTAVGIAGIAVGVGAAGAAFLKLGEEFQEYENIIRQGTGATGKQLEGLLDSMKAVGAQVPNSLGEVAKTIADLSTRLGVAGPELERIAKTMLDLADVTGSQVSPLIAASTRLFGDWSISTNKQVESMDYLFKVSQSTGIQIQKLMELTVQYGAPLRSLGFDLETSAAMLGKWEKEGVNMETVLAGLRFGLGEFAKAGKDPVEALTQLIEKIKGAGNEGEAMAIAFEAFGKRAGPDLGRAILEGRLDVEELIKVIKGSTETIEKADDATKTFTEELSRLGNQAKITFEPLGKLAAKATADFLSGINDFISTTKKSVGEGTTTLRLFANALNDGAGITAALALATSASAAASDAIRTQKEETDKLTSSTKEAKEFNQYFAFSEDFLADMAKEAQKAVQKQHEEQKKLNEQMDKLKSEAYDKSIDLIAGSVWDVVDAIPVMTMGFDEAALSIDMSMAIARSGLDEAAAKVLEFGDVSDAMKDVFGGISAEAEIHGERLSEAMQSATRKSSGAFSGMGNEISTVLTNLSQELADKVTGWAGPFQTFASKALASLVEGLFSPVTQYLNKLGKSIGDWLGGVISGDGGGFQMPSFGGSGASGSGGGGVFSGGGLNTGGLITAGIGGLAAWGATSSNSWAKAAGLTELGLEAGGAIAGGLGYTSLSAAFSSLPIIGAAFGAVIGGLALAKWAQGPDSYEALAKETQRDLGVSVKPEEVKAFMDAAGISEAKAWDHRVEIEQSPMFMAYLLSLGKNPTTKWGAFQPPLEWGKGGYWGPYNDVYGNWVGNELNLNESIVPWRNLLFPNPNYPEGYTNYLPAYKNGIERVPYDQVALLHKDERVLTAEQNKSWGTTIINNFYGPIYGIDDLDEVIAGSYQRSLSRGRLQAVNA